MPYTKLKFSEFIDLLLARLYDLESQGETGRFFDLSAIASELSVDVPQQWVFDAAKVLESRGLAQVLFAMGGRSQATLTGEGRIFVEEEAGSGIIRHYHSHPADFLRPESERRPATKRSDEREPSITLLREIRNRLAHDAALSEEERRELSGDIDAIEHQLRKRQPNRAALAALLEPVSQVPSLAGYVATLIRLLNA